MAALPPSPVWPWCSTIARAGRCPLYRGDRGLNPAPGDAPDLECNPCAQDAHSPAPPAPRVVSARLLGERGAHPPHCSGRIRLVLPGPSLSERLSVLHVMSFRPTRGGRETGSRRAGRRVCDGAAAAAGWWVSTFLWDAGDQRTGRPPVWKAGRRARCLLGSVGRGRGGGRAGQGAPAPLRDERKE